MIAEIINELASNPTATFLFVLVIVHMTFLSVRSWLDYQREARQLAQVRDALIASEKRVNKVMGEMDTHRSKLYETLKTLNEDLSDDVQAVMAAKDGQKAAPKTDG